MKYLIIGSPNVGKSSIYNILTGKKTNIVHSKAGTTRDWHKNLFSFSSDDYIYDSPGIILNIKNEESIQIKKIVNNLISQIDIIFFVVEYNNLNLDNEISILDWIRQFNKEVILLVNKKDNNKTKNDYNFFQFGINEVYFLSCSHRKGFNSLINLIIQKNNTNIKTKIINKNFDFSVAVFGKPNAGKSTFLNTFVGFSRSLVSFKSGTTSDYVFEDVKFKNKTIRIYDTAGIKRSSKIINKSINYLAIKKSIEKIYDVNSSLILIDSTKNIDRQDKRIINLISNKSKKLIIIFNKIDLITNKSKFKKEITNDVLPNIYQLKNIKLFFISSFSKPQIFKVFEYLFLNVFDKNYNINTVKINSWLKQCTKKRQHPLVNKRKVNFKYAVKIKDNPITIKIFCNYSKKINKNYLRYIQNSFNEYFKIINQNSKFIFSSSENPYI